MILKPFNASESCGTTLGLYNSKIATCRVMFNGVPRSVMSPSARKVTWLSPSDEIGLDWGCGGGAGRDDAAFFLSSWAAPVISVPPPLPCPLETIFIVRSMEHFSRQNKTIFVAPPLLWL